jgi:hypothetical protein
MATCSPQALPRESTCFHCIPPDAKGALNLYLLNTLGGSFTARQLSEGAALFRPLNKKQALAAKVFLLASINSLATNPAALQALAACWQCIPPSTRLDVETFLYATAAGQTNPQLATRQIGPYKSLYPIRDEVEIFLLNNIQGGLSLNAITSRSACLMCLGMGRLEEIYLYLLCRGTAGRLTPPSVSCGTPTFYISVLGAGDNEANGGYSSVNGITYTNNAGNGYILKVNGGMNAQILHNGVVLYQVTAPDFVPCGTWTVVNGTGPAPAVGYTTQGGVIAATWAQRVVHNGGAVPGTPVIVANQVFVDALISANIWSKMLCINLIASKTPLFVGPGLDPWVDVGASNFVAADLSLGGLKCDGTKALNTGIVGTVFGFANAGLTIVATMINPNNGLRYDMGYLNSGDQSYMFIAAAQTQVGSVGHSAGSSFSTGLVTNTGAAYLYAGYLSWNRTSATLANLYYANNDVPHASIGTNTNNQVLGIRAAPLYFGAVADSLGGAIPYYSKNGLSFAAMHDSLTAAESQAFFNAINTLRTSYGGGYGDIGASYADDWSRRVVAAGGAAPGTASKLALHNLATSLWSAGLLPQIVALVGLPNDSLIAAITPIIYQGAGNASWTNNNFVLADLTVNGLLGAATKYLATGIIPSAAGMVGDSPAMTSNSAGLFIYSHTDSSAGVQHDIAVYGGAFHSFFGLLSHYNATLCDGGIWRYDGNDYLTPATPIPAPGFYSLQRTAANAIALYFANSSTAHAAIASNAGAMAGAIEPTQAVFAFGANNNGGGMVQPTLKRLSIVGLSTGLSAADDAALYAALQAYRTALGGGFI